jgi:hypothetical protein
MLFGFCAEINGMEPTARSIPTGRRTLKQAEVAVKRTFLRNLICLVHIILSYLPD